MPETLPDYWGQPDQLPPLPKGHRYRSPNNSEYLLDIPARLKTFTSRKLTVKEALYLVSNGYDLDVNVHGDPIASVSGHHSYVDAVHLLGRLRGAKP